MKLTTLLFLIIIFNFCSSTKDLKFVKLNQAKDILTSELKEVFKENKSTRQQKR